MPFVEALGTFEGVAVEEPAVLSLEEPPFSIDHASSISSSLRSDLAARDDTAGIREIAENMWNDNKNIHGDCMNVMYEISIIDPNLVMPYVAFIKFQSLIWQLTSKFLLQRE